MSNEVRDEFVNDAKSTIGVVTINHRGEPHGIAVPAGETVWLSEAEQILTANAPRDEENNVLANGQLRKVSSGRDLKSRRPLAPAGEQAKAEASPPGPAADTAETGTVVPPQPPAETGQLKASEEVATPSAQDKPKPPAAKPTKAS